MKLGTYSGEPGQQHAIRISSVLLPIALAKVKGVTQPKIQKAAILLLRNDDEDDDKGDMQKYEHCFNGRDSPDSLTRWNMCAVARRRGQPD